VLRRLEAFVLFFAMILAVTLEGACVYWMCGQVRQSAMSDSSLNFVGEWTSPVLPQGWLLGALLVLTYRVAAMFIPPRRWGDNEFREHRLAFLRLWRWAMALIAMQALAFLLGRVAAAS
jgi:hypothetical protein